LIPVTVMYGLSLLADSVLLALDRSHIAFRLTLLNTVLAIGGFVVGLHWGVIGVAASYAIVTIPICTWRLLILNRLAGVSLGRFCATLSRVVQAVVLMATACLATRMALTALGTSAVRELVTVIVVGVATYTGATYWRNPALIAEIKSLMAGNRPAATTAAIDDQMP
jgi:O-antigen/teichoic acid export membrane protein